MRLLGMLSLIMAGTVLPALEQIGLLDDGFDTELRLGVGTRLVEEDDFQGLHEILLVSLDYRIRPQQWPMGLALGIHVGGADTTDDRGIDFSGRLAEFTLGVTKGLRLGKLNLDVEAGPIISTYHIYSTDRGQVNDTQSAFGAYGAVHATYTWRGWLTAGVGARYTVTENVRFQLAPNRADFTGLAALATVGIRF